MRIYMIFFLIFIFFSFFSREFQLHSMENPLNISKISKSLFKVSLIAPYTKIETPIIQTTFTGSNPYNWYLAVMPQIGHYNTPQYDLRPFLGLIQLPSSMVATTIPDSIKRIITPLLDDIIRIDYTISFWGPYLVPPSKPKKAGFIIDEWYTNLIFHPWARTWAMNDPSASFKSGQDIFFDVTIPMGIFQADGISPVLEKRSVSFGTLTPQAISVHGTSSIPDPKDLLLMFSPANAYFLIDKQRAISNFWAIAHSPNKKYFCISYIILINSQEAKNKLETIFFNSITLGDFINNLENAAEKFAPPDNEALKIIAQNIRTIVKNKLPTDLIKTITEFTHGLEQLRKFL